MGNHRAHRGPRRSTSAAPVVAVPAVGKRRATAPARRSPLLRSLPSAPILLGVTALAISAGGAVTASDADLAGQVTSRHRARSPPPAPWASPRPRRRPAATPSSRVTPAATRRPTRPTRSSSRPAEAQAKEQHAALEQFAQAAEKQSAKIRENQWVLPLESYRISATFGASSYLWSSVHTGLDMSAPSGTAIRAIANGVITETGYDGSYGNKTVLTLEDGTELWYCHQTSIDVSVGDTVRGGEVIGTVGSTGNSTGPHLHLEVRPGGGDPVDPFTALLEHGVTPDLIRAAPADQIMAVARRSTLAPRALASPDGPCETGGRRRLERRAPRRTPPVAGPAPEQHVVRRQLPRPARPSLGRAARSATVRG